MKFLRCYCSWERGTTGIAVSSTQKQYMVCEQKMWKHLLQLAEEIQRDWIQFVLLAFWYSRLSEMCCEFFKREQIIKNTSNASNH